MITKRMLLDSMRAENRIIKHLATKVRPETLDWRPTERQRSLRELMRYMTRMAIVPAVQTVTGNWDHAEEMENEAAVAAGMMDMVLKCFVAYRMQLIELA